MSVDGGLCKTSCDYSEGRTWQAAVIHLCIYYQGCHDAASHQVLVFDETWGILLFWPLEHAQIFTLHGSCMKSTLHHQCNYCSFLRHLGHFFKCHPVEQEPSRVDTFVTTTSIGPVIQKVSAFERCFCFFSSSQLCLPEMILIFQEILFGSCF